MQTRSHPSPVAFLFRAVALACLACAVGRAQAAPPGVQAAPPDLLSAQIQRFADYLDGHASTDASFVQVKQGCRPLLVMAQQAIADGRRLAAAYRLAQVSGSMAGIVKQLGYEQPDQASLEAAWREVGADLGADATAAACRSIRPAALRALAEAAAPQVHGYHAASLDYGRATMPEAGLFYLGAALGSRDLVALLHDLREPTKGSEPELRTIAAEIDDLEHEMLMAYRPPLSLDRHGEFVAAHGALQEAKDLDASGMRHGALLRYLQAAILDPRRPDRSPGPGRVLGHLVSTVSLHPGLARGAEAHAR